MSERADPHRVRRWFASGRAGRLSRRTLLQRLVACGIPAPMASLLLTDAGIAQTASPFVYKPTRRGGGGPLKLLLWQGPTLLNAHFATGTKDLLGASVFYESLVLVDRDGELRPQLAAEMPSRANGGVAADGRSVTWKLKRGVAWHDGKPFNADDLVFNAAYASDPATAAVSSGAFTGLRFEKLDTHTVRVLFPEPTPWWAGSYALVPLIPRHLFEPYMGSNSREAPANLKPVGTGPYRFVDFKPGDLLRGELNPSYHQPNRPFFDTLELKGGGDAVSAARAVLQTGEYDHAWNLQVEDEVLLRMEAGGKGRVVVSPGGAIESIRLNAADPSVEVDGERAHPKSRHWAFSDPSVRQAVGLLVDRQAIQKFIYGRGGEATPCYLNQPAQVRSPNLKMEFSVEKASALLDGAGWKRGKGGMREKNGRPLKLLFTSSTNGPRQKTQAIVKQACAKAGIDVELKNVPGAVFFSTDVGNPDTTGKFWADLSMYTQNQAQPDPQRLMESFTTKEISSKANKWSGLNTLRWSNRAYDAAWDAARTELDPVKRAQLFIRMNDLLVGDGYIIPVVQRPKITGLARSLQAPISGWDSDFAQLADWYRT
jgi:peptide/nickel transport system substrate-binding protein